jgi:hypothetical protein
MNTPKYNSGNGAVVKSSLEVKETEDSKERSEADLKVSDPKPERAKAILDDKFQRQG